MKITKTPPKRQIVGVHLQSELYDIIEQMAKDCKCKSKGEFVRMIILDFAASLGYNVEDIENPTWGVRRDLASGDPVAIAGAQESAKKARAVQAANRARRAAVAAQKARTAERLYKERISDKS